MGKIDILLATYNGEKYIEQQLLSLVAQTEKQWTCYVHDDGSTDNTIEIIKKWANIDKRIILIEDRVLLKNAGKNFLHLVKYSKSDFVCFCDQDDIWLDTKLEKMLNKIEEKDNSKPQVIFSNAYLWDSKTNFIHDKATIVFPKKGKDLLFLNCGIQGASSIFNKKMVEILNTELDFICMHDYYLTLAGVFLGEIDYIHECLMLYRQHSSNVTGNLDGNLKLKAKLFFKRRNPVIDENHFFSLISFIAVWKEDLLLKDVKLIEDFIKMKDKKFISRVFYILRNKFTLYNSRVLLIVKILFRNYIGKFNKQ